LQIYELSFLNLQGTMILLLPLHFSLLKVRCYSQTIQSWKHLIQTVYFHFSNLYYLFYYLGVLLLLSYIKLYLGCHELKDISHTVNTDNNYKSNKPQKTVELWVRSVNTCIQLQKHYTHIQYRRVTTHKNSRSVSLQR